MSILKRAGRLATIGLLSAMAVGGVLRLSGHLRYLVTNGVSMTPLYHSGDLVVVTPASHYRVGQIAAYHSRILNTTVLHRIVRISDGHYSFKGDHNSWLDPEQPTAAQLLGTAGFHLPHGGVLLAFHGLLLAILAVAGIAVILVTAPRDTSETHPRPKRPRLAGPVLHRRVAVGLFAGEAVLAVALAVTFAFHAAPATPKPVPTLEKSTYSYNAQLAPDAVYPAGTVNTGDPVFTKIVPSLTVRYVYQATGPQAAQLAGTTQLSLAVTSANGWHTSFPLGTPTAVTAGHAQASATLNISAMEGTLTEVRTLTGVDTGTVNVTVHAITSVTSPTGTSDQLDVPLNMQMGPLQVSLQATVADTTQPTVTSQKLLNPQATATPRLQPGAGVAHIIRLPLLIAMLLVTIALALHFYPARTTEAR